MRINSPEELQKMQEFYGQELNAERKRILVCAGTGCVAGGSLQIYARLKELMKEKGIPCEVFLHDEADGPLHTEPEGGQTAQIEAMAERLKCTYIRNSIDPFLEEAAAEGWGTVEALSELLSRECETRRLNGIRRRMSRAHFPYQMRFEMFVDTHLSPEVRREARILETMAFLDDGSNVVLVGNPGVGKTALAVALGTKACEEGRTVAFINVPNLVIEMKEAMSLNQLTAYKKGFERYDLVILDDLGYCSFNRECGEVLFNLLSSRNGKGSTIITTNLMFDRWDEVFDDPVLTGAIVDRIAHKAHVVDMTGESYRVIETKEWIERANKMMD